MSYFDFGGGPARPRPVHGWNILEALIDARAKAEQQFLADLRRNLDAGLRLAEEMSRQGNELGRTFLDQVSRALSMPGGAAGSQRSAPPYGEYTWPRDSAYAPPHDRQDRDAYAAEPAADADSPVRPADGTERPPALRLVVPAGTRDVGVPVQLRNHRDTSDVVTMSASPLRLNGAAVLPTELIRFQPESIVIPAHEEGSVQVLVHVGPNLAPGIEYWSEVVIAGTEVKRVPLVVLVLAEA